MFNENVITGILVHELCHDGDSITQVHSPEFFKNYHSLSEVVALAVDRTFRRLTPKALAAMAKREGVVLEQAPVAPAGTEVEATEGVAA